MLCLRAHQAGESVCELRAHLADKVEPLLRGAECNHGYYECMTHVLLSYCVIITHRETGSQEQILIRKSVVWNLSFVSHTHALADVLSVSSAWNQCLIFTLVAKFSPTEPFYFRELNTAHSGFWKASHCAFLIVREWYYQIQHLFFPRDTLSLFPDSEWKVVGGGLWSGGRMWWTHLTRANRGAIKESAQPERQGLTFIEVDVYCSSCCTCQEGIKDFFVMWSKLEKSKMLK